MCVPLLARCRLKRVSFGKARSGSGQAVPHGEARLPEACNSI